MINKGDFYQKIKERKIELRERDSSFPKWSWMPKYRGTVELLSLMALPILTIDQDKFGIGTEVATSIILKPNTLLTGKIINIGQSIHNIPTILNEATRLDGVLYNFYGKELNDLKSDRMEYSLYPFGELGDKTFTKQCTYLAPEFTWHIQVNIKDYGESWVLLK